MKATKKIKRPRMGRPFYVHVSPDRCPCCHWTATTGPAEIGDGGWYVMSDPNRYVGTDGGRHRFDEFFKHHGITPKRGEQIRVRLVEVP